MIRKLLSQLAFCIFLVMGLSCSFAFAEEVELNPDDDWYYQTHFTQALGTDVTVLTDSLGSSPSSDPIPSDWLAGAFLASGSSRVAYNDPYVKNDNIPGLALVEKAKYLNLLYDYTPGNATGSGRDFECKFENSFVSLNVENLLPGWYRYEADFYVGVAFILNNNYTGDIYTCNPQYTYQTGSVDLANNLSSEFYYVGEENIICNLQGATAVQTRLIHFRLVDTFEVNPEALDYTWNIGYGLQLLLSQVSYQGSSLPLNQKYRHFTVLTNNRFTSALYGNVEPVVSPTPTPTPYPGQDTQESINSGVQQIVQDLNVYATPIPTPADLTIDETVVDALETMTLPDLTDSEATFASLWEIFTPAVWFLALMASSIFVVSIFLWILRGGWL